MVWSIAQIYMRERELLYNKTAYPEEGSEESTSEFKCKICRGCNRMLICYSNELSISEEYHPKTCQKEAIEKNHLQVVRETASPREICL